MPPLHEVIYPEDLGPNALQLSFQTRKSAKSTSTSQRAIDISITYSDVLLLSLVDQMPGGSGLLDLLVVTGVQVLSPEVIGKKGKVLASNEKKEPIHYKCVFYISRGEVPEVYQWGLSVV